MTSDTPSATAAKKDTQKLQRAIVDGLEDVKAQDVQVFNTEHLSPLFERVIVASGTSNRQTKALAASVRDAVREAGFPKPRIEGEDNGEWIIVDCGAAVAHIMQPAIRQYYHLEEIWGEKPVRLKFGAAKPASASADKASTDKAGKAGKGRVASAQSAAGAAPAGRSASGTARASTTRSAPDGTPSLRRSSAAKTAIREAERAAKADAPPKRKPAARSQGAAPAAGRSSGSAARSGSRTPGARSAPKPAGKVLVVGKPARKAAAKTGAKTGTKTGASTGARSGSAGGTKVPARKTTPRKA